jgi:hypothetical protein
MDGASEFAYFGEDNYESMSEGELSEEFEFDELEDIVEEGMELEAEENGVDMVASDPMAPPMPSSAPLFIPSSTLPKQRIARKKPR